MYRPTLTALVLIACCHNEAAADDFFLTIGGGYSPSGNQASLERNVLFYQRVLNEQGLTGKRNDVFFADGRDGRRDLQVVDRESVPKANRLMAEFLGSQRSLGLSYRNHDIADVAGATSPDEIRNWFRDTGKQISDGDRLILYVTSHGGKSDDRNDPYNTSISLWNNQKIKVTELVEMLDLLPDDVTVVAVMVQCHAGGFARFIYNNADPDSGLSAQKRCGFFATVHDRPAAGCTPDINEANYVEYSTYFWEAVAGHSRTGEPIEIPDYDGDGTVSFDEAHAYTVLTSDTIDLPIRSSGEFLGIESLFANNQHPDLLPDDADFDSVLNLATPAEKAVLLGLSKQLGLDGDDRVSRARREAQSRRRTRGRTRTQDPSAELRQRIARDLKRRWPELANVLNPVSIELLTTRSEEFVRAVENHRDYQRYRELADEEKAKLSATEQKVKYERLVRTAENVILRANLVTLGDAERLAEYRAIVEAESQTLRQVPASDSVNTPAAE